MKILLFLTTTFMLLSSLNLLAKIEIENGSPVSDGLILEQFHIEKSENKNQVVYSVELDQNCKFREDKPIFAYWQMLEIRDDYYERLNFLEKHYYSVTEVSVEDDSVKYQIKAFNQLATLKNKFFTTTIQKDDKDACTAKTFANIEDHDLNILNIKIYTSGMNVRKIDVSGIDLKTDQPIKITINKE